MRLPCLLLLPAMLGAGGPAAELPLAERISGRAFPSIFQAWSPADNLHGEDKQTTAARHDLLFSSPGYFLLRWNTTYPGLGESPRPETLAPARRLRAALLERNPHMVLLAEIRYRDAGRDFLPAGHPWWKRDASGKTVAGWAEGGFAQLDFANPEYRAHVAAQARAVVTSGVVDGVMLDWWQDDDDRLELIRAIRAAIGDGALVLVNANDRTTPRTAAYINGYFMECTRTRNAADWKRIAETLAWGGEHLRAPRVMCLETWYHHSRQDLNLMRATTTLSLVLSDGYALFSDPNPLPTPDHLHDWYPFWDKSLGKAAGKGARRKDGAWSREFEKGTAIFNPFDNQTVTIGFPGSRRSLTTGAVAAEHTVPAGDGDIFLVP